MNVRLRSGHIRIPPNTSVYYHIMADSEQSDTDPEDEEYFPEGRQRETLLLA